MNLSLIYGTVIGLLLGLAYCYWKQLQLGYDNRGLIGAASDLQTAGSNFIGQLKL